MRLSRNAECTLKALAYGKLTVTHDITRYTRAKLFSEVGKTTFIRFLRFSTVAGERGAADAERDIRGFSSRPIPKRATGIWWQQYADFHLRDPLKFPDLNHVVKRDPRTNLRNPTSGNGIFSPCFPKRCIS